MASKTGRYFDLAEASPRALAISQGQLPDTDDQTLTGTIDPADAGLTISIYDGATLLGATIADVDDVWTFHAVVSGAALHAFSAKASSADDETLISDIAYLATSDGQTITFADPSGDSASLYGVDDVIYGSNGRIYLDAAQASVVGGGDTISLTGATRDRTSLYDTNGAPDSVTGDDGFISLNNAQASVSGGYNTIFFSGSASDAASLAATNSHWDWVYGNNGVIHLDAAQASVIGGGDQITLTGATRDWTSLYDTNGAPDLVTGDGDVITLNNAQASVSGGYNTIFLNRSVVSLAATNGHWDWVYGDDGVVTLTSAEASVIGGGDQITLTGASRDYLSIYGRLGTFDTVHTIDNYIGDDVIALNDAQAAVLGGNNTIYFDGESGNDVIINRTNGYWDWVYGDNGIVQLGFAQASVIGGNNYIEMSYGQQCKLSLYGTNGAADYVSAAGWNGYDNVIALNDAQTTVLGGYNAIYFEGASGNAVTLVNTIAFYPQIANWDVVYGSNGSITLNTAQTTVVGGDDTIDFASGSYDAVSLQQGKSDVLQFRQGIGGTHAIVGFDATDTIQFSAADFPDWAALSSYIHQTGGNTQIWLDPWANVTLYGTLPSSLTASEFRFV